MIVKKTTFKSKMPKGLFILNGSINNNDKPIDLFITLDQKLINFDFNKYTIKSYKKLDELNNSKMLDYSLEIS